MSLGVVLLWAWYVTGCGLVMGVHCFQLTPAMECGQTTQICGATTCLPSPPTTAGPALAVPALKTGSVPAQDQACKIHVYTLKALI